MAETTFRAPVRSSGRGDGGHLVDVPTEVVGRSAANGAAGVGSRWPRRSTASPLPWLDRPHRGRGRARRAEGDHGRGRRLGRWHADDRRPQRRCSREVGALPPLLALRRNEAAGAAFEGLSFSHRRAYVDSITEAKLPETRARRVERTIQTLLERTAA